MKKLFFKVYDDHGRYQAMMPIADSAIRIVDDAEQKRDRARFDNATLLKCCNAAAEEISSSSNRFMDANAIAAIIYKHMRNGREL